MTDAWYVYVIVNPAGVAYTGIAKDVGLRVERHNGLRAGGAKFTRGRGPWICVHQEGPLSRTEAAAREAAIKRDDRFKRRLKAGLAEA